MSSDENQTGGGPIDPAALSLSELRELRSELQQRDDVVSYARRVAQARLDLVNSELARRSSTDELTDDVTNVLSQHLTGGPARPPRPAEDLSDDALSVELDAICAEHHYGRVDELDEAELRIARRRDLGVRAAGLAGPAGAVRPARCAQCRAGPPLPRRRGERRLAVGRLIRAVTEANQRRVRRVAVISLHTSPLLQPGSGDSGGMNVYVRELVSSLSQTGVECITFTRADREGLAPEVRVEPNHRVVHIEAGPHHLPKEALADVSDQFCHGVMEWFRANGAPDIIHGNYWLSGVVGHHLKHELGRAVRVDVPHARSGQGRGW